MLDFGYISLLDSEPDINGLLASPVLAFDIESTGVSTAIDKPLGFSLANKETDAYYVNMTNRFFTDLLANDNTLKIAHNAKFDRSMFKKAGIEVNNLCDPMIAAHLLEEDRLSLKVLLKRCVRNFDFVIRQYPEYTKHIEHSTLDELVNHFGTHATGALILWNRLQRELRANNLWRVFWDIEMPLVPVLSDMELNGALIDADILEELGVYYDGKIELLEEGLTHFAGKKGINFNSSDQVADLFYETFNIPKPPSYTYKDKKRPSVDKKYLEPHKGKFPILNLYLKYKAYRHLKDTYVSGILKRLHNGRVHTNFNQTRTRTGRLSSTDPNLQNIPERTDEGRKIRRAFVAPTGKVIMIADQIQVELKKMACLSNCKALLDAFKEGRDIHTETAIRVLKDANKRREGKTKNFQLLLFSPTRAN